MGRGLTARLAAKQLFFPSIQNTLYPFRKYTYTPTCNMAQNIQLVLLDTTSLNDLEGESFSHSVSFYDTTTCFEFQQTLGLLPILCRVIPPQLLSALFALFYSFER